MMCGWTRDNRSFRENVGSRSIRRAIRDARCFVALLSSSSVSRRGYLNKEIAEALSRFLMNSPESEIFPSYLLDSTIASHQPSG